MSKTEHYAFGEDERSIELEAVMRLPAVKRWHMIDTTRQQNLAEHTANVAMLAWLIAKRVPGVFVDPAAVLECALTHDVPEVFIGDIPSHSKHLIDKTAITVAEIEVTPAIFNRIATTDVETLIKMCDLADGIRFIRLHGVDVTAEHARVGLERQLAAVFQLAIKLWPPLVTSHVFHSLVFYIYEAKITGNGTSTQVLPVFVWGIFNNLARGQGDKPWGARRELGPQEC